MGSVNCNSASLSPTRPEALVGSAAAAATAAMASPAALHNPAVGVSPGHVGVVLRFRNSGSSGSFVAASTATSGGGGGSGVAAGISVSNAPSAAGVASGGINNPAASSFQRGDAGSWSMASRPSVAATALDRYDSKESFPENGKGVAGALVRFLRAAEGPSEALLCGWAGMLPAEEQTFLKSMLNAGS